MTRLSFLIATGALLGILAGCGSSDPNPGGPPSCSGGGLFGVGCLCVETSCTCTSTEPCTTTCGDDCAVACNGTGGCTSACGVGCTATCNGTDACHFHVGMGSEIVCNGTGGCDTICEGGACRATCNSTEGCELSCPSGDGCEIIACTAGPVTDCGGGVLVCGRECP
jgi:hypothetical protein